MATRLANGLPHSGALANRISRWAGLLIVGGVTYCKRRLWQLTGNAGKSTYQCSSGAHASSDVRDKGRGPQIEISDMFIFWHTITLALWRDTAILWHRLAIFAAK